MVPFICTEFRDESANIEEWDGDYLFNLSEQLNIHEELDNIIGKSTNSDVKALATIGCHAIFDKLCNDGIWETCQAIPRSDAHAEIQQRLARMLLRDALRRQVPLVSEEIGKFEAHFDFLVLKVGHAFLALEHSCALRREAPQIANPGSF
jgi:hypothetical protein